jgi:Tol biopolymer transport system component
VSNIEYSPELAAALDRLMPFDGTLRGDWDDVLGRVHRQDHRPTRLLRNRPLRLALVAAAIFLLLAGVATAAYFIRQALVHASLQPAARVVALGGQGRLRTLYHCPADRPCAPFVRSVAFSRDGRRLAFFVEAFNSPSPDEGLHVVDLASGADRQLPPAIPVAGTPGAQLQAFLRAETRLFGCDPPVELTWSPDGSRLAYACTIVADGDQVGRIYTIRPDGTGRRLLRTGTESAYWPTWSPNGKRVAFSTEPAPVVATRDVNTDRPSRWVRSAIYVVGLDGSHQQVVTRAGAAPDWSPDGTTIVYSALACGVGRTRLVTPDGRDVTPHSRAGRCGGIGPPEMAPAAWSPGGHRLAAESGNGLYVMDADGSHVIAVAGTDAGTFGDGRPAWQPPRRKGKR